ncbi:proline-rich protein 2-like [Lutra lutra]|uniref:proline-rich protein 2-like n=1 Tax=Lutra lutra TaxID=9657 RepID=UPI001FD2091A|nr:proline-rich protein 2-like [Lutra lutra]
MIPTDAVFLTEKLTAPGPRPDKPPSKPPASGPPRAPGSRTDAAAAAQERAGRNHPAGLPPLLSSSSGRRPGAGSPNRSQTAATPETRSRAPRGLPTQGNGDPGGLGPSSTRSTPPGRRLPRPARGTRPGNHLPCVGSRPASVPEFIVHAPHPVLRELITACCGAARPWRVTWNQVTR